MLAVASKDENLEVVKILLAAGADFQVKDDFGKINSRRSMISLQRSLNNYLKNCLKRKS
jgi:hypothetical protein